MISWDKQKVQPVCCRNCLEEKNKKTLQYIFYENELIPLKRLPVDVKQMRSFKVLGKYKKDAITLK